MNRVIITIIIFIHSQFCMADGWSNLDGKNENGACLDISPASYYEGDQKFAPNLYVVLSYQSGTCGVGKWIEYKYQSCETKTKPTEGYYPMPIEFICEKDGKSPLSGASYKIVPNNDPKDCSYMYMYICTKGCDDPQVPKKIIKEPWECIE